MSKCPEVVGGMRCLSNECDDTWLDARDSGDEGDNESLEQTSQVSHGKGLMLTRRALSGHRRSQPGLVAEQHAGSAAVCLKEPERGHW